MSQHDPQKDLLIQRALEASADESDWAQLEALAEEDSEVWRDLSMSLRDTSLLGLALNETVAVADNVELPAGTASHRAAGHRPRSTRWIGWAAAATIAALWLGSSWMDSRTVEGESAAGLATSQPALPTHAASTPDEALELYRQVGLREGRIVSELPLVLVDSEPVTADGKTEVTYLRRLLERRMVDGMAQRGLDDAGRPVAVPVSNTRLVSHEF